MCYYLATPDTAGSLENIMPSSTPSKKEALPFRVAARDTLRSAFDKMMENAAETRSGLLRREPTADEIEALHDMRVGSRRLRAALAVFARVFDRHDFRKIGREIAAITDALGAVRDWDTQREALAAIAADLPKNEAYGVRRLSKQFAKQRDRDREKLIKALNKLEKSGFEKRFAQTLKRATGK